MLKKKCPVCKTQRTIQERRVYGNSVVTVPAPLYQQSYPGEPEHISPRCLPCFDMAVKRCLARTRRICG